MVSVIVPVFNKEKTLPLTLDSILAQTWRDWECILVDDGSTDQTLVIAESYCSKDIRIKLFHRDREPKNANTCRNIGLEKSKGDYIIFFDSDDWLDSTCLEDRMRATNTNPLFDFWVFKVWYVKNNIVSEHIGALEHDGDKLIDFLQMRIPWITGSVMWRRSFIIDLKGFDENLQRLQDVELHIRALLHSGQRYFIDSNGKPDWFYRFRPYNRHQRDLDLLGKKIDSSIYLYKKLFNDLLPVAYIPHLQTGVKKNFLDFTFDNALNNFKGMGKINVFVAQVKEQGVLDIEDERKLEKICNVPRIFYKIPGFYRMVKLYLES